MGPRLFARTLSGLIAGAFACWAGAAALTIGDRVDAAIPGGGKGTIIEIGAGVPYAGYYKIHFDGLHARAPAEGMWVDPKRYTVKALGSNGEPTPEAAPAPRLANTAARPIADLLCRFEERRPDAFELKSHETNDPRCRIDGDEDVLGRGFGHRPHGGF